MPLRVGSIKQGIVYAANLLYEDLYTSSKGRCIMEFKHDIISCFFRQGGIICREPYRSKGLFGLCILKTNWRSNSDFCFCRKVVAMVNKRERLQQYIGNEALVSRCIGVVVLPYGYFVCFKWNFDRAVCVDYSFNGFIRLRQYCGLLCKVHAFCKKRSADFFALHRWQYDCYISRGGYYF